MNRLVPYLTFNGNCKDAMTFYQKCFGGELYFQTIGDSPLTERMPEKMKKPILLATLETEYFQIMATDMSPEKGLIKGNSVSILVHCQDEKDLLELINNLSIDAFQNQSNRTEYGSLFASLQDRFGVFWLLTSTNLASGID